MQNRSIRMFTHVWGDKYLDWMNRGLCRSLAWPKNREALSRANTKWTIFSDLNNTQRIYEIATKVLPFHQIELKPLIMDRVDVNPLAMMMDVMRVCLLEKSSMMTCPPDTIFSDGAVDTLLDYSEIKDTCVMIPHPRVLPGLIDTLCHTPPTNEKLVSLAIGDKGFPHASWQLSDGSKHVTSCFKGGICWHQIEPSLWSVVHRLPTCYMANFNDEDRKFFSRYYEGKPPQYGMWDWAWPAELLKPERQRVICTSDAAFACEVTDEWKNVPTHLLANPGDPDAFFADKMHNNINRQYICQFRGVR